MENVVQARNEYRKQQWTQIIRECQSSGLSNKEYCWQQGISKKSYYYWLRKLRDAAAESIPQIVEVEPPANEEKVYIRFRGAELTLQAGTDVERVALMATAMIDLSRVRTYYVACGYTGLRRGIDGLASIMAGNCGRIACISSAGGGQTGSRCCTTQGMDMCCCTSG